MGNWYEETIVKSELFHTEDRVGAKGMGLLYPPFRKRVEWVMTQITRDKMRFDIFETYRSQELQQKYHQMGVSLVSKNGMHHFGVAVDIVPKDDKGRWTWKASRDEWLKLGRLVRRAGLVWGGDWRTIVDCPHVQLVPVGMQDEIVEGQYPDLPPLAEGVESGYGTYEHDCRREIVRLLKPVYDLLDKAGMSHDTKAHLNSFRHSKELGDIKL